MSRYLMTHSLLSSWLYAIKDNSYDDADDATTERDPMAEFLQVLRREPTEPTPAMQRGIDFEDLTTAILTGQRFAVYHRENRDETLTEVNFEVPEHPWYEAASTVAQRIQGGVLQYKASREVSAAGMTLLLYGRLDCLRAGEITDIKFSKKYDIGKYFDSTQHPMYFELIPEASRFTYLVSNGSNVWSETYRREETRSIYPVIENFFDFLRSANLLDLYKEKWLAL